MDNSNPEPVPEPATLLLLRWRGAVAAVMRRRRSGGGQGRSWRCGSKVIQLGEQYDVVRRIDDAFVDFHRQSVEARGSDCSAADASGVGHYTSGAGSNGCQGATAAADLEHFENGNGQTLPGADGESAHCPAEVR
jgi:hypothetical protein